MDRDPDGGIGGLTVSEERELDELLNGPHKLCTCAGPCMGHLPKDPSRP